MSTITYNNNYLHYIIMNAMFLVGFPYLLCFLLQFFVLCDNILKHFRSVFEGPKEDW